MDRGTRLVRRLLGLDDGLLMTLDGQQGGSGAYWGNHGASHHGSGHMHGSQFGYERSDQATRFTGMAYWGYGGGIDHGDEDGSGQGGGEY